MSELKTINIELPFEPRAYQLPVWHAFHKGYKRILYIAPRRCGKDYLGLSILIVAALQRVGGYAYVLPTYESARGIVWENVCSNGMRMLNLIPEEIIESKNQQMMMVKFRNGSYIKLLGSDNYNNSIVGRTFAGMLFSEFCLQDENAWKYASPILAESDGFAIFLTTVRGKNFLFDMYEETLDDPKWFTLLHTIDDTNHISPDNWAQIQKEHSWEFIQQEYYCNFNLGIDGTIYGRSIDKLNLNGQIGNIPHNPKYRVNSAWDIGRDTTAIILWQVEGTSIKIINYHEDKGKNLEHYINVLEDMRKEYGYIWNKHFFPHDMNNINFDGPMYTRVFKAQQLGLENCIVVKKVLLDDGIEWTRTQLMNMFIDRNKCKQLIKCLENYRYELNVETREYSKHPVHNWASHGASAMMYLSLGIPHAGIETTAEELRQRYENSKMRRGGNTMVSVDTIFSNGR